MKLKYRNALARLISAGMVAHASAAERVLRLREISNAIDDGQHTTAAMLIEGARKRLAKLQSEHPGWAWLESELVRLGTLNHFMDGGEFEPDPRGVVELDPDDPKATVCGHCGRGWDDTVSTSCTPTPSGRCPFEYNHEHKAENMRRKLPKDLEEALEYWHVGYTCPLQETVPELATWHHVSNSEQSIVAYFATERDALRYRLFRINLDLNGADDGQFPSEKTTKIQQGGFEDPTHGPDDEDCCDECGNEIPDHQDGGLANKHHADTCSLYDPEEE